MNLCALFHPNEKLLLVAHKVDSSARFQWHNSIAIPVKFAPTFHVLHCLYNVGVDESILNLTANHQLLFRIIQLLTATMYCLNSNIASSDVINHLLFQVVN